MKVNSITYYGWSDNLRTVEKRITYDYEKGNDVTIVEHRSYLVQLYNRDGAITVNNKGNNVDQLV